MAPPPGGRGWGVALSSPSSPVHSALQPAYSSPRVYGSAANIYAEVETDTEIDSGFTEESVSQEGDKSLYTAISQHGLSSAGQLAALGYTMDTQVRGQRHMSENRVNISSLLSGSEICVSGESAEPKRGRCELQAGSGHDPGREER